MDEIKRDDLPPIEEEDDEEAAEVMYLRPATPPPDAMTVTEDGQLHDRREGVAPPVETIGDILDKLIDADEVLQTAEQGEATFQVPHDAPDDYLPLTIPDPEIQEDATPAFEDTPPHPYPVVVEPEVTFLEPVSETEDTPPNPVPVTTSTPSRPIPAQTVPEPIPLPPLDTQPSLQVPPPPIIPAAPYTPPPLPPAPLSAPPISNYWLQQRIQAYLYGGYKLHRQQPMEAVLSYGKPLPLFWWVAGMSSIIGMGWYVFILLMSGFRRDIVYILIEPDGYPYEEGPGAAHIRRRRSSVARRWGVVSILLVLFSVFTFFLVILAGAIITSQYRPELVRAYPELSILTGNVDTVNTTEANVDNVRVMVLALVVLLGLSGIGFLGGAAMFIISYLHAAAFRVDVAPLPGMR